MRDEIQKILKIGGVALFFGLVLFYIGYRAAPLVRGPIITVTYPTSGIAVEESVIEVTGIAKKTTKLTMNSRELTIDDEGNFIDRLLLVPGYNVLVVEATDKFGKSRRKVIEVVLTKPAVLPPPSQQFFELPVEELTETELPLEDATGVEAPVEKMTEQTIS